MCEIRHLGRTRFLLPLGEALKMDVFEPVTCEYCLLGRYLSEEPPRERVGGWRELARRRAPPERPE